MWKWKSKSRLRAEILVRRRIIKVKVKLAPEQAIKAKRGSSGVALFFWGWVVKDTPRPLYPREWVGNHCTGDWVGPGAGLDGCGKSRLHWVSIPGPSWL